MAKRTWASHLRTQQRRKKSSIPKHESLPLNFDVPTGVVARIRALPRELRIIIEDSAVAALKDDMMMDGNDVVIIDKDYKPPTALHLTFRLRLEVLDNYYQRTSILRDDRLAVKYLDSLDVETRGQMQEIKIAYDDRFFAGVWGFELGFADVMIQKYGEEFYEKVGAVGRSQFAHHFGGDGVY